MSDARPNSAHRRAAFVLAFLNPRHRYSVVERPSYPDGGWRWTRLGDDPGPGPGAGEPDGTLRWLFEAKYRPVKMVIAAPASIALYRITLNRLAEFLRREGRIDDLCDDFTAWGDPGGR